MSAQSIKKAKKPRVVTALETKLKIVADFETKTSGECRTWIGNTVYNSKDN
jgi:hypothetical protein